jgi:hypothetical protein
MIKDLCCVDVFQTKAERRQKMNYTHKHTQKNADDHTSHADTKENNNRSFTILFFLIFLFEINRSIDRNSRVCTRSNVYNIFFQKKRRNYSIV